MTSILQFSDIQFGVEDKAALDAVSAFAKDKRPDLHLICGDITQTGKTREFKDARRWIDGLAGPKLITPGNHDTPMFNLPFRALAPFRRYETYIRPLSEPYFADDNIMIVTHNTARGLQLKFDWSLGVVDRAQLELDIQALQSAPPGTLKMIASHHPYIYPESSPLQKTTKHGPEAIRQLSDSHIDGVLTGHVHAPFMIGRKPGETTLMSIGSGTLSRRTRGKPASFNHIEIDATSLSVTPYFCEGGRYSKQETWRAPRRKLSRPVKNDGAA